MKKYFLAVTLIAMITGCYYDNIDELHPNIGPCVVPDTISYANDIVPIMTNSCGATDFGCHNTSSNSTSGWGLNSHLELTNTVDNTEFLKVIKHDPSIDAGKWMPKGSSSKIDDCSIQKIENWINQGMQNN
jgi:hypothetical protein